MIKELHIDSFKFTPLQKNEENKAEKFICETFNDSLGITFTEDFVLFEHYETSDNRYENSYYVNKNKKFYLNDNYIVFILKNRYRLNIDQIKEITLPLLNNYLGLRINDFSGKNLSLDQIFY